MNIFNILISTKFDILPAVYVTNLIPANVINNNANVETNVQVIDTCKQVSHSQLIGKFDCNNTTENPPLEQINHGELSDTNI